MLSHSRVQTPTRQDATNSRGFKEGEGVRVKADAKLPKKLSYACCCTGVVARIGKLISVKLNGTQNFETPCILVKPEWLENLPGQTSIAESVQVSPQRLVLKTQGDCQQPVEKPRGRRKCSPNKKPASGSLVRCISVKKGKEYSTWQYNYDVRDPDSKRRWKTIKEGVPKYKVPAITDAIKAELSIPEILALLGKEPRGQISS